MGEMGASRAIAHGPDAGRGRLQPLIDLHVAARGGFDARQFESDVPGVGRPSAGHEKMRAFEDERRSIARAVQFYRLSRFSLDPVDMGARRDVDSLVLAKLVKRGRDVLIFPVGQTPISVQDGYPAAETAHGLGQFEADITAAEHQQVAGDVVQFEGLDVGERACFRKTRDVVDRRARARADDDIFTAKNPRAAVGQRDLDGLGANETPRTHDELRATLLEIIEVHIDQPINHPALAIAYDRHVDPAVVLGDAEFPAPEKVGSHLGAMNDVLARQTGDVGTRPADVFPLDDRRALSLPGQGPRDILAPFAAAQYDDIEFFHVHGIFIHGDQDVTRILTRASCCGGAGESLTRGRF